MKNIFKKIIIPIITWQSMHLLGRFNPKIVAVTGSVGKTSTKEAIYHLLKSKYNVRRSEKSFNSEIGVPLTILGLKNGWLNPFVWSYNIVKGFFVSFFSRRYPEILVLEVGADKPGDIGNTVSWVKPDIAVITALPDAPVHAENFPSVGAVYEEKLKLLKALSKNGVAVLNRDDKRLMTLTTDMSLPKTITFSHADKGNIFIPEYANPYPFLAAAKVAEQMNIDASRIETLSKTFEVPPGRMKKLPGINGSTIIDDTYNASPAAALYALNVLKDIHNAPGKKIAVLGDMLELGEVSEKEHRRVGKLAAESVYLLVGVGNGGELMTDEAEKSGMKKENIVCVRNSVDAGEYLKNILQKGDFILFKGSQGVRMERAVLAVLADPDKNRHLLVRQDKEWERR